MFGNFVRPKGLSIMQGVSCSDSTQQCFSSLCTYRVSRCVTRIASPGAGQGSAHLHSPHVFLAHPAMSAFDITAKVNESETRGTLSPKFRLATNRGRTVILAIFIPLEVVGTIDVGWVRWADEIRAR